MMLWSPMLAVVPVTIHLSLREAIAQLSTELIVSTARIVADGLTKTFWHRPPAARSVRPQSACRRGRLAWHGRPDDRGAGGGDAARRRHRRTGPLPADTMFHAAARKTYDCAICMYHDQALIPIKTLAFDDGVNVTLGLPFIRTSPDHGTAFDIAGTGRANPASLIAALRLAARHGARASARHERDRRPAAAARGHSRDIRLSARKVARPEFPARPQPHRPHRARRGRARRTQPSSKSAPGRAD